SLAFTPDGKALAAGVRGDVCFWDCRTGREVRRFRGKNKGILALTFSRDKKTFFCSGSDNKLYHWDIATGKQLRCLDYFAGKPPRTYACPRGRGHSLLHPTERPWPLPTGRTSGSGTRNRGRRPRSSKVIASRFGSWRLSRRTAA